jgi:hypothetical protein
MRPKSVPVAQSITWFSDGWRLFAKNPALWLFYGVVLFILIAVGVFTLVGYLVLMLVLPAIIAGMVYAAAQLRAGRGLAIEYLFRGFQDQTKASRLLVLGLVMLGATLVSLLIVAAFMGPSMVAMMGPDAAHDMVEFGANGLIALLLFAAVHLLLTMLLAYAIPLVMLGDAHPAAAMRSSFSACLRNLPSLLMASVILFVLAGVATLPLLLGWLVLLPWLACTLYRSYEDIFG